MKKKLLISIALMICFGLVFSGCGRILEKATDNITERVSEKVTEKVTEKVLESTSGEDVDLNIDDGKFSITTEEGTLNLTNDGDGIVINAKDADGNTSTITGGDNATLPQNYPKNILPLLKENTLFISSEIDNCYAVAFTSNADYDNAMKYYKDLFEKNGTLEMTMDADEGLMLTGSIKEYTDVTVLIGPNTDLVYEGKTVISITAGKK